MVAENQYYSYNINELPVGCQYCVRGEKLVLFITGICPRTCYFCPLSDLKYGNDVIYANERKVETPDDVLLEAELMQAKGAGITGGDPLSKLDRTVDCIKLLKAKFGKQFHIHLYTSLNLVSEKSMERLFLAGLDEIRFHPDLETTELWPRIALAQKYSWHIGIEIPLVPTKEKEIKALLDFVHDKVRFINFNELERADNKMSMLGKMGFTTKDQWSYAIKGSLELGINLLDYAQQKEYHLAAHVCTAKLKDGIQLANRIKRESQNVRKQFDVVDSEGILHRGALYLQELAPDVGYRKKLETIDKLPLLQRLGVLLKTLQGEFHWTSEQIQLDPAKPRLILSRKHVKQHKKYFLKKGLLPALVKEYPTADQLELEVEFLK